MSNEPLAGPGKTVCLGICFTLYDEDILDWVNMLSRDVQSPRTWIRAILDADELGLPLDAGTVYSIPSPRNGWTIDDMVFPPPGQDGITSWAKRGCRMGAYRDFVIGSVLTISTSDKIIVDLKARLQEKGIPISPYIKMVIRRHIRVVRSGKNVPPQYGEAKTIITMAKLSACEGKIQ